MKLVDLNVLLYVVNSDSHHHDVARRWWEDALAGEEPVGLAWIVLLGFLRISTRPQVFPDPLEPQQALERIDAWIQHPTIRVVQETDEHWRLLRELVEQAGTAGNLTTDAHLAAMAIGHGASLVSFDADFGRFSGVRWETP